MISCKWWFLCLKITLSTIADGRVHIGDRLQLKCEGNLSRPANLVAKANRADCFLGQTSGRAYGTASPQVNLNSLFVIKRWVFLITEGLGNDFYFNGYWIIQKHLFIDLMVSILNEYFLRIIISSVDKTPAGAPIKFGQRFAIMSLDEKVKQSDQKLYTNWWSIFS